MITFDRLGVVLRPDNPDQAKFNAGMAAADGVVHMLYRFAEKCPRWHGRFIDWTEFAAGGEFPYLRNCIRYARLSTQGALLFDSNQEVISPRGAHDTMGCEDPRIVRFEGAFYIFYCVFDGRKPRVAIARTSDFTHYERLGVVDHSMGDKDAVIFPERIGGRIAYMHRVALSIQIDYFDSIDQLLSPLSWVGYEARVERQTVLRGTYPFECMKIGCGVPPLKTEYG